MLRTVIDQHGRCGTEAHLPADLRIGEFERDACALAGQAAKREDALCFDRSARPLLQEFVAVHAED